MPCAAANVDGSKPTSRSITCRKTRVYAHDADKYPMPRPQHRGQRLATLHALEALRTARDDHARAEVEAMKAKARYEAAVLVAYDTGAGATKIATLLGVSRQRVYQILTTARSAE